MKRTNRLLALAIAALMLMCSLSLNAFAYKEELNYLLLGDSIAFGAGVRNHDDACFGRIVADTNGYNYKNLARNGSTTKDLMKRLKDDDAREAVSDADIISISIGGNNFLFANIPSLAIKAILGDYSDVNQIVADFYSDFCDIISTIKNLNPRAIIIVQTIYNPMPGMLRPVFQNALDIMNSSYAKYLSQNPGSIVIADVSSAIGNNLDYIAIDFIHPSAQGNIVIAQLLLDTLYDMDLGDSTEPKLLVKGVDTGNPTVRKIVMGIAKML